MKNEKKINLCLIGPDSIHLERWADWFIQNRNYNVTLIKHGKYKNPLQYLFILFKTLFKYLKVRKNIDITHIHYVGNFAFFIAPFVRKNLVLNAWGSDVLVAPQKSALRLYLFKKTINRAERIITDADHVIKVLNEEYEFPMKKTSLCLYGTDVNKFKPENKINSKIRKTYSKYNYFIISLRNLEPIYNIETLIKSVRLVVEKKKNVLFLIYGNGSEKEMLQELVKELNLEKNVLFLGRYNSEKMQNILPNMDIYVSTSLSDAGLSASTAEAMASGVIPIITDFGDNSKWVIDGKTGYLFPLKDENILAKKILFVLENKDKLIKVRSKARLMIVNNLNRNKEMDKADKIYTNLVNLR